MLGAIICSCNFTFCSHSRFAERVKRVILLTGCPYCGLHQRSSDTITRSSDMKAASHDHRFLAGNESRLGGGVAAVHVHLVVKKEEASEDHPIVFKKDPPPKPSSSSTSGLWTPPPSCASPLQLGEGLEQSLKNEDDDDLLVQGLSVFGQDGNSPPLLRECFHPWVPN